MGSEPVTAVQGRPELPRGAVTFLFTDVEGSTKLLHELGPQGYADALARHRDALRGAFSQHGGVEVDTQGDAFFVAFADASGALAAAREGQRALEHGPIRVRMGLHSGEPVVTDEGYVGIDVHRAARICAAAHGGQVVLSDATRALAGESADVVALGLHRLKDLGAPEKLFQLGPEAFPPLRSLNATNLPAQPGPLVGREREVVELVELVGQERLVTLTGAGGSGKTRLALQVAAELVETFPDGVFWVPLASVTEPELVAPAIVSAIAARGDLAEVVGDKGMLLLLDNLEQVVDAAPQLSDLLRVCPRLHVLATSRALLRIQGEREYMVEPLPAEDAVALFGERAAVAEPPEAVAEICRRLDGLPLAVELAAARTRVLPPGELLARLEQRLPLLTAGRRDAPARHRTLRATIAWSYELLDEEERRLFRRLAVFAGSFEASAAEGVADADLDLLQSLVDKSLVRRWGSGRLGMLETIHEFASEELEAAGEGGGFRRRHALYFLSLAESANLSSEADGPQRLDLVAREIANLRAAIEWALAVNDVELAGQLAVALEQFWVARSPFEGKSWVERVLARADELTPELRARALRTGGGAAFIAGDFEEGARLYERSLEIYRDLGDERGVGHLLHRLAVWHQVRGDLAAARRAVKEGAELLARKGSARDRAMTPAHLGDIALAEGDHERGLALMEESAQLAQETGFLWWAAVTFGGLTQHALELERWEDAERWGRHALRLAHEVGERQFLVYALADLARLAARAGLSERAGTLWGAVETEERKAPVGQWEAERDAYVRGVMAATGEAFERGRAVGRALTLADAVRYALEGTGALAEA